MRRYFATIMLVIVICLSCNKNFEDNETVWPFDATIQTSNRPDDTTNVLSSKFIRLNNGLILEKIDTNYFLEEDMRYTLPELKRLSELSTDTYHPREESVSSFPTYWSGRVVPFSFDSSCSSSFQTHAYAAMNAIASECGVRFIAATTQTDKIVFHQATSGNNSPIGKSGGAQTINIQNYTDTGTIIHEILHSLGFYHEHSRNDRDDYLIICWSNIKIGKRHNFDKHSIGLCTTALDTASIMIYGSMTTDVNFVYNTSLPMLTDLNGGHIEWKNNLSPLDIQDLRNIYGPPYHKMSVTREILNDYYEYGTEIYEEEVTYTIHFYSDEAYTTPTSISNSRKVIIRETTTYCDVFQQIYSTYIDYVVTVPAGSSSYTVGTHHNYEYYAYGSPSHIDIVSYSIVNAH